MYSALPVYMLCYILYVHVFMHPNHLIADFAQASYLWKTLAIPSLHHKSFGMASGMAARLNEKPDESAKARRKRVRRFRGG